MELSELLGTSFACDCGRVHHVPVRRFVYEHGAVDALPQIIRQDGGNARRVAVVADVRTGDICGRRVEESLRSAGIEAARVLVPDRPHAGPMCDDVTVTAVVEPLRGVRPDLVVAVGSGVINDLSKWAAFQLGIPYLVVATAASMNGYSSANVAPTVGGVKRLIEARAPVAVLAEPGIIEQAPARMLAAGFGDTIAKHQSTADWVMNRWLSGEYYCGFCAGIVARLEPLYLAHPEDIRDRRPEAVGGLFEALFWTGMAMTLMGTSVPASGGEHLFSHTLDMIAEIRGERHDLHGRQVGLGTVLSAALYQRILALDSPVLKPLPPAVDDRLWSAPSVAAAVAEQYQAKQQRLEPIRHQIVQRDVWDRLRTELAAEAKSPATIHTWLKRAGAAVSMVDIGCSRERIKTALLHMHEIRKRFTIVDLAWLCGILPAAADDLIDQWLA
ncbi:MAG: sn-glycerol-1-phosphate dehydrogenase [Planctomycetes bacterium]|nr:sn-glycerol-1-phosphate dehydrogenase [Planctomycetota bacterium]